MKISTMLFNSFVAKTVSINGCKLTAKVSQMVVPATSSREGVWLGSSGTNSAGMEDGRKGK